MSSCAASCSHIRHNCSPPSAAKHLKYKATDAAIFGFLRAFIITDFLCTVPAGAPPLSPPPLTPDEATATALQVKRRDVGAAAASPAQQTENECIISIAFFLPAAFYIFFRSFFLLLFSMQCGKELCGGGGRRKVGLGSLGCCRSLYMCVSAVCVGVWVFIIFRLRKILCAHTNTHTHTLTHTPAPTKNCERNNWHRLMALTSTALPAATAASSLSPFGPKKKKNSRENE